MKIWPFLTCREAAHLVSADLDRRLKPWERLALSMHLKICTACPIVVEQFRRIRESVHAWRDASES